MIAYCGIDCSSCKAFIATKNDDDDLRAEVASEWSEIYNVTINSHHINCDGCKNYAGTLFFHCTSCEIRECGKLKGVSNCGECDSYPCGKLDLIHNNEECAKKRLDDIAAKVNI